MKCVSLPRASERSLQCTSEQGFRQSTDMSFFKRQVIIFHTAHRASRYGRGRQLLLGTNITLQNLYHNFRKSSFGDRTVTITTGFFSISNWRSRLRQKFVVLDPTQHMHRTQKLWSPSTGFLCMLSHSLCYKHYFVLKPFTWPLCKCNVTTSQAK